ncbi:MAG: S1C family serine protease, partial [Dehalococcoidia bacterium]
AYLGIEGADLSEEIADVLNLPTGEGALVQSVVPSGPADDAGVRGGRALVRIGGREFRVGGDIIVEAQGEPVRGMDDVIAAVEAGEPGDELELTLLRGDDRRTVKVTLGNRPARPG